MQFLSPNVGTHLLYHYYAVSAVYLTTLLVTQTVYVEWLDDSE
jgi:hypothetical protein